MKRYDELISHQKIIKKFKKYIRLDMIIWSKYLSKLHVSELLGYWQSHEYRVNKSWNTNIEHVL